MTVQELIDILKPLPKDLIIWDITDVMIVDDYPLGDGANPDCEYGTVVLLD